MKTAIIISMVVILLGLAVFPVPRFRKKIKEQDAYLAWIGFLVSIAGLIVTVFSVVPKVTNISNFNIELKEQVEKQIRQIEEKTVPPDTVIRTVIRTDTVHHTHTVIVRDTIPVFVVIKPENGAPDEDGVTKALQWLERELEKQKK
jgi:hypothetical protein